MYSLSYFPFRQRRSHRVLWLCHATNLFSACGPIPEDVPVKFPRGFLAIAGDVALLPGVYSDLHAVSDVFRLENNLLDTGLGTGLGNSGFLFSGHFGMLPNPSTYSANAVGFRENPEGLGDMHLGNGTDYFLGTGVLSNGGGSKAAAAPKNATLELADGEVAVASSFGISIGQGPAQDPYQNAGQASSLAALLNSTAAALWLQSKTPR